MRIGVTTTLSHLDTVGLIESGYEAKDVSYSALGLEAKEVAAKLGFPFEAMERHIDNARPYSSFTEVARLALLAERLSEYFGACLLARIYKIELRASAVRLWLGVAYIPDSVKGREKPCSVGANELGLQLGTFYRIVPVTKERVFFSVDEKQVPLYFGRSETKPVVAYSRVEYSTRLDLVTVDSKAVLHPNHLHAFYIGSTTKHYGRTVAYYSYEGHSLDTKLTWREMASEAIAKVKQHNDSIVRHRPELIKLGMLQVPTVQEAMHNIKCSNGFRREDSIKVYQFRLSESSRIVEALEEGIEL